MNYQLERVTIGKKVAMKIFNKYHGIWEVEPIENSKQAYCFWKNTIEEYTNNKYEMKENKVLIFKN